jgi:glycosyltransferase involved in cell wall biosynthesis
MKNDTAVLLITRKYPPSVGGMENYSYSLYSQMQLRTTAYKISLGRSQKHLFWFIPWCLLSGLYLCYKKKITHIHISDTLLAPVGLLLNYFTDTQLSITAHGLDVIYQNIFYQFMIKTLLPKYRKIICNSEATKKECIKRGVPATYCYVAPCGIDRGKQVFRFTREAARAKLNRSFGTTLDNKKVLATVGRLVPRKGVAWFIENVLSQLPEEFILIVVGDGPEAGRILSVVQRLNLQKRVHLLGKVSQQDKDVVYDAADVFVMPNLKIDGDMEGFGIVALEAGMHNLPVVASAIEGITDAVIDGETGVLVNSNDPLSFIAGIEGAMLLRSDSIVSIVENRFSWDTVFNKYIEVLEFNQLNG